MRADQRRDHAALVDVADQHDRQIGRLGKAHVGDVVRAQVDLRRAARALGQDQIRIAAQLREALEHVGHQVGLEPGVVARRAGGENPPLNDHLRADLGLRLEQHRVHVHRRRDAARPRLQRLRAPDLAAVRRHRRIVAHVLRLERPHAQPAPRERPAQARHQQRLADVRAGALEHQRRRFPRSASRAAISTERLPRSASARFSSRHLLLRDLGAGEVEPLQVGEACERGGVGDLGAGEVERLQVGEVGERGGVGDLGVGEEEPCRLVRLRAGRRRRADRCEIGDLVRTRSSCADW